MFVHDIRNHEAYKRGKAIERQDRLRLHLDGVITSCNHVLIGIVTIINSCECRPEFTGYLVH